MRNERPEPWVFILHSHVAKRQITFLLKETFYIGHYNQVAAILTVLLCSFSLFFANLTHSTLGHAPIDKWAWRNAKRKG